MFCCDGGVIRAYEALPRRLAVVQNMTDLIDKVVTESDCKRRIARSMRKVIRNSVFLRCLVCCLSKAVGALALLCTGAVKLICTQNNHEQLNYIFSLDHILTRTKGPATSTQ